MAKVLFTQEEINDLTAIYYYTNGLKIKLTNIMKAWSLPVKKSQNPNIGKNYTEISKHLLGLKSGRHIFFISENSIAPANK